MGKEQYTRLTLKGLIAKKEQMLEAKKKTKTVDVYVKSLGGTITIKAPTSEQMSDAVKMEEEGNKYLVYQCCVEPDLKSAEAQEAFGGSVPTDIVDTLFEPGEVAALSIEIARLAGYGDNSVKIAENVKN